MNMFSTARKQSAGGARILLVVFACLFLFACGRDPSSLNGDAPDPDDRSQGVLFEDVTADSGIDMVTVSGAMPSSQILEVKGGGLALIDFDADGDRDLFIPNGATLDNPEAGPGARLYRNDGGMHFTDVTAVAGLDHRRWSFGTAVGDVDADGHDDIFIACFGADVLLRNRGDGTFEDVTSTSGLGDEGWATSAALADLDGDDDLDLFVARYLAFDPLNPPPPARFKDIPVLNGPRGLPALADLVYENDGSGRFHRYEGPGALARIEPRYGLNIAVADFTGDGLVDVFVGNDSQPNHLYRNDGNESAPMSFTDVGAGTGVATNVDGNGQATMGIAVADVNGDGAPDLFTSNFSSDMNTMHVSTGTGFFDDRTRRYGLALASRPYLGWASGFFDLDHDGDEDLLVFNGHVYPQASLETMGSPYRQTPLLSLRSGDKFDPVTPVGALAEAHCDRSAVFDDLDGDGDIDVVVSELNGPIRVLRNDLESPGGWLTVELSDRREGIGNRHAVGATVDFEANGWRARRWVLGGGPFQSTWSAPVHVGLPAGVELVTINAHWPDGFENEFSVAPNSHIVLERATESDVRVGIDSR